MNICAEVGSTNESIAREVKTLEDLEIIIGRGLQSFFEVGQALATIRDNNLYKAEYKTFENYCRLRWQLTPQHAGRQIKAAEIVKIIEPIGSIPIAESQVRPLFDLNPDHCGRLQPGRPRPRHRTLPRAHRRCDGRKP